MVKFPDSCSGDNRDSAVARDLNVEYNQIRFEYACGMSKALVEQTKPNYRNHLAVKHRSPRTPDNSHKCLMPCWTFLGSFWVQNSGAGWTKWPLVDSMFGQGVRQ